MSIKARICFLIIAGLLSACDDNPAPEMQVQHTDVSSSGKSNNESQSIATVGSSSISVDVLRYYLAQRGFGARNNQVNKENLNSVLNEVISLELFKQAAIKNHLDQDPATVIAMTRILSNKYQTEVLAKNSKLAQVSAEEIKARFEQDKQQYMTPARRRGAIISVRLNASSDALEQNKANEKLKLALKSSNSLEKEQVFFGNLAERFSDDVVSKSRRGDIGWVVEGANINRYEPAVIESLFSLSEVGEVSSVIKGDRGYYLVKLVDSSPAEQQTLKQVERTIQKNILSEKRHAIESTITKELRKQFEVNIDDSVVNDFIAKINTKNVDANNMPPSFPISVESK